MVEYETRLFGTRSFVVVAGFEQERVRVKQPVLLVVFLAEDVREGPQNLFSVLIVGKGFVLKESKSLQQDEIRLRELPLRRSLRKFR